MSEVAEARAATAREGAVEAAVATWRETARHRLLRAIVESEASEPVRGLTADVLLAALDEAFAGIPEVDSLFGGLRADAAFWADCASAAELEAFAAAALDRIDRRDSFAMRARKRLFARLWETFPKAERVAFLRRVDPEGRIRSGRA